MSYFVESNVYASPGTMETEATGAAWRLVGEYATLREARTVAAAELRGCARVRIFKTGKVLGRLVHEEARP